MTIEKSFIYDLCQNSSVEEIPGPPGEALAVDEDHDWELGSGSNFFKTFWAEIVHFGATPWHFAEWQFANVECWIIPFGATPWHFAEWQLAQKPKQFCWMVCFRLGERLISNICQSTKCQLAKCKLVKKLTNIYYKLCSCFVCFWLHAQAGKDNVISIIFNSMEIPFGQVIICQKAETILVNGVF